ncbi:hypothetical protein [Lentzea sp. NPDC092896]|uniref:nSTAND1 domain-containing NTPase n=1 Tax=Lentzea sp. NPDC092896 TaxID=3364127 RepID=UPI0037FDF431
MSDAQRFADFRVGAVRPPRSPTLVKRIAEFLEAFPEASIHRQALQLLGSDWVFAAPDKKNPDCWTIYIRFGSVIENLFDITREIVAYYSPYEDLQIRSFDRLERAVQLGTRSVTPDLRALYSRDSANRKKVRDWAKGAVTTIPLDVNDTSVVEAAADLFSILAEFLSTRDLYYETLPVTGEDFFGRRTLLLSLMRDIQEHRVCGVFGLRKSGKTSVVRQVMAALEESSDPWALAFVDLETLPSPPTDPIQQLIKRVTYALIQGLRPLQLRTHELKQLDTNASIESFAQALKACLIDADRKSVKVLLALDEIEFLLAGDINDSSRSNIAQFLAILRSLVQEHESFLILFSGLTSSIIESGRLFGRPNPLYSWAKPYFVTPLSAEDAQDLIVTLGGRMAVDWSPEAQEEVYTETDGHAFYVRSLSSSVVKQLPPRQRLFRIERELVQGVLRSWKRAEAARVREIFETLEAYYPDERTLLDIAISSPADLADIADEHPTETEHLLNLGLLNEGQAGELSVSAIAQLNPARKQR